MKWSDVFFDYHTIAAQKFLRAQKRRSREEGGVEGQNTGNRYCEKNSLRRVDRKKKKRKGIETIVINFSFRDCLSVRKKKETISPSIPRPSILIHNLDVPRPSFVHSLDNTDRRYFPPPSDQLWFLDRFLEKGEGEGFPLVRRTKNSTRAERRNDKSVGCFECISSRASFQPRKISIVGHGYRSYSWSVATPDAPRDGSPRMDGSPWPSWFGWCRAEL